MGNDTSTLQIQDLVQGVTTICQLDNQEYMDFYPAVRAAFEYAKTFNNGGKEPEVKDERKKTKKDQLRQKPKWRELFTMMNLRFFLMVCQTFKNDDMDERKTIKKKKFLKKDIIEDLQDLVGNDVNMSDEFDALDQSGKGKITF